MNEHRTIIPVTVNPSDDQRFIRFHSSGTENDLSSRMSTRMRDFEEECRRWREKFFNESRVESGGVPSSSLSLARPRMRVDFPDFPEFSTDWPVWKGGALGNSGSSNTQKSFIEEDYDGRKKYKIQFDIGEFKPEELNVKVEGRLLIVKGDRQVKVGNATESKQFNRELTLPEFVEVKALQSYLSDDGKLTLEAPVIMDRVYGSNVSQLEHRQASPGKIVDTTFIGGRQPISSSFGSGGLGTGGNTQSSYSSTSSSSYRQEGGTGLGNTSFHRSSPLRDHITSTTSSTSSTLGGGSSLLNNQAPTTYSTITSRPDYTISDRGDGTKTVSYKFNLGEFAPEDIAIQVNDTMLKITAIREERDNHNSYFREFKREIDGAEAKKLTNTLGSDGILSIQIPVRDYRPPPTPIQSNQFNLGSENDSYSLGDQQLKLTFDLSGYKPEDVNVKVNENVLKVQAIHIDNTRGKQINREYVRQYVLPDSVDIDNLRAKMSEDSTLTVEVPIPHDRVGSFGRQIKINS
ncbi:unnamed protein product [Didymodactylos carnosus]|uniref:SHSP domain-containing protein n=1 Tax=Didymodactylos carnosus TaxID=1234261 RepID=A0A814DJG2_9BILA|nr:unnamed protein product [Didymodactylos carnosus]CAF1029507.1 unnamed protein product [Didymodactylos carnosus]CAF3731501.1 unnamed protein product [Didymodactylos carnosus]CAF3797860.1 unnamed protein product [Didymodactylos carnosus]